jgi:hypothetical protein
LFKDFDKQEILDSIEFDEFEKSFYLTKSQEEIVISLYNGKNPFGESFESTEEMRRSLDRLVETAHLGVDDVQRASVIALDEKNLVDVCYRLPDDLMFITLEQIVIKGYPKSCYDGTRINVQPVTQDDYNKIKNNPFKGPTRYKALRLDPGYAGTVRIAEIISKYDFEEYTIRYIRRPLPIILEDLPNDLTIEGRNKETQCELSPEIHNKILERAVLMALRAKSINTDK